MSPKGQKTQTSVQARASSGLAGPIRVSPNGRYFVDAEGRPFFWLGDTAWPLFAQYSKEDAEKYLSARARQGFTVIQGVLAWGGGTGFEGQTPGPNYAGHTPRARSSRGCSQPLKKNS